MTTTSRTSRESLTDSTKGAWVVGTEMFAAVLLVTLGTFQAFEGLSAILNDNVYAAGVNYVYAFDLTAWGWIHLTVGLIALISGIGIFADQGWARVVGLILAVISALVNFMFIPYYPIWSLVVIAVDVAAVWALSTMIRNE